MEYIKQKGGRTAHKNMLEYRYDTQLLIEGTGLDEDDIHDYFVDNFNGDCLIATGDEDLVKIHYHTNEPWKVLEYARRSAKFSTLLLRIWTARSVDSSADIFDKKRALHTALSQ